VLVLQEKDGGNQMIEISTPLSAETVASLHAGDRVLLSGTVYTARDEAHLKIAESGFPFSPEGAVIYHCGPVVADNKVIAAGPTTSARMNKLTAPVLDAGIRGMIGKGGMSAEVLSAMAGRAVYFAFTGGCAALAADRMTLEGCHFAELGMAEAVWQIRLDKLPVIVAMDSYGKTLYK
jgi:hydro-lyases, Fe-S type, tartrate/fumarate subfamily, beta region